MKIDVVFFLACCFDLLWAARVQAARVAPRDSSEKRQVLVFRHCYRSTRNKVKPAVVADFTKLTDYTSAKSPRWNTPKKWCTAKGVDVFVKMAKQLQARFAVNTSNIRFVTDLDQRDWDSAAGLMKGFNMEHGNIEYDGLAFSTTKPNSGKPLCDAPSAFTVAAERRQRFEKVPVPGDFQAALREMQALAGVGRAGPLAGDITQGPDGQLQGPIQALRKFATTLLYSYASDLQYVNATKEQVQSFIGWEHYKNSVTAVNSAKAVDNVVLLSRVLTDLSNPEVSTSMYVGHQGNLAGLASLLDVEWTAPPYAGGGGLLPTMPGSALRFELDLVTSEVQLSFVYIPAGEHEVRESLVTSAISLTQFKNMVQTRLRHRSGAQACFDRIEGVGAGAFDVTD